ncbi:MAG: 4a-hydroxytetrahydrobiopterin dehydratase [Marinobacter sp.]|uniref:4a-hydroxytetrahydrobiopterin dehydratase n=1 Tax=Marinobacter sp. TaxID=50741 RepID=UPI00299DF7DE|nr:4a-hydroxytetrahydrobiopterin dehydratase [Marinobacter sp.]MDX1634734.1 4a-hydroxytetrahydrobiopterin dehydratase [Marinobacter sp.]
MTDLKHSSCEPCNKGSEPLLPEDYSGLLGEVPDWQVVEYKGEKQLERTFKLKNFAEALAFTNRVGALAEAEDHHPAILLEYGKVRVNWWTHAIGGLHRNDFIMAARTDDEFS